MKPYAYAVVQGNKDAQENVSLQFDHPKMCGQTYLQAIPLYTHPHNKQIDEEIMKPHEKLGVAIADAGYAWTPEMRSAWEELDKQKNRMAELEKTLCKPVAWMSPDGKVSNREGKLFYIPLYTHPHKELSDEEIAQVFDKTFKVRDFDDDFLKFAKAVIKASRGEE